MATPKKKKAKRKAKKKTPKKKKQKKKSASETALQSMAKLAGAEVCHLCDGLPMRSLDDFEQHLFEEHGGITMAEYRKMYPKAAADYHVDKDLLRVDEVYRAMTHMVKYGRYPAWFDASKSVDVGAADEALLRVFASQVIDTHQDRVMGLLRYINIVLRRQFEPAHAALGSEDAIENRARWGIQLVNESVGIMHRIVDLIKKTDSLTFKSVPTGKTTFVAAAQIENADGTDEDPGDKQNRLQHQMTAVVGELHGMVQSFIMGGPEHGEKPPSQVVDVEIEEVIPDDHGNSGGNGHV